MFDENNHKVCAGCHQSLHKDCYGKSKRDKTGYLPRCKSCVRVYKRKSFLKNKDELNRRRREQYKENPDKRMAWSIKNPDKVREYKRRWKENNKHNLVTGDLARRTRMKLACPKWLSEFDKFYINELYDLASKRSNLLNSKFCVDHIVPIMSDLVCGLHCPDNLEIISSAENMKKSNRYWPDMPEKE